MGTYAESERTEAIESAIHVPLRAQKVLHVFHRLLAGVRVKSDGSAASYADIFPTENLSSI